MAGLETHGSRERYFWDGLRRPGDHNRPWYVFQYTLAGEGCFEDSRVNRMTPGRAFLARIPSDHRYYLPESGEEWTFLFILAWHPYVVQRLEYVLKEFGALSEIPVTSAAVWALMEYCVHYESLSFADSLAEEQMLLNWAFELERFLHNHFFPTSERERVLAEVRERVALDYSTPLSVTELAGVYKMSRTRFSHWFANTCGVTPARFVLDLRLQRAAELLRDTKMRLGLKEISQATGFSDANLLCKAFRRHFGMSPGVFRNLAKGT